MRPTQYPEADFYEPAVMQWDKQRADWARERAELSELWPNFEVGYQVLWQPVGEPQPPNPEAVRLRREWMESQGLSQDEIEEYIRDFPPIDEAFERKQLAALADIHRGSCETPKAKRGD